MPRSAGFEFYEEKKVLIGLYTLQPLFDILGYLSINGQIYM